MKTSKLSPALTCAFICIISISAHAFVIKPIDKFTLDIEPIIPKAYIDPDSLGITVRYEIEEATLMPDNENMVDFRLYIPGFGMTSDAMRPIYLCGWTHLICLSGAILQLLTLRKYHTPTILPLLNLPQRIIA